MRDDISVHYNNLAKHGVTVQEVRECFREGTRKYFRKARRGVYQVITQTLSGRYLELLYEKRAGEIYVFHAMDARDFQIKLLKRRGKRK